MRLLAHQFLGLAIVPAVCMRLRAWWCAMQMLAWEQTVRMQCVSNRIYVDVVVLGKVLLASVTPSPTLLTPRSLGPSGPPAFVPHNSSAASSGAQAGRAPALAATWQRPPGSQLSHLQSHRPTVPMGQSFGCKAASAPPFVRIQPVITEPSACGGFLSLLPEHAPDTPTAHLQTLGSGAALKGVLTWQRAHNAQPPASCNSAPPNLRLPPASQPQVGVLTDGGSVCCQSAVGHAGGMLRPGSLHLHSMHAC